MLTIIHQPIASFTEFEHKTKIRKTCSRPLLVKKFTLFVQQTLANRN